MNEDLDGKSRGSSAKLQTIGFRLGALGSTLAVAISILMLGSSFWLASDNLTAVRKSDTLAGQSQDAQLVLDSLSSTLDDAETGQRGYLLTGKASYLEPYDLAKRTLPGELGRLRLEPHTIEQTRRLDRIQGLATSKMAELDGTIAMARSGRRQAALNIVGNNQGERLMDALRVEIHAMRPGVNATLQLERARARSPWPRVAGVALGALSFVLLGIVALDQRRGRLALAATLASLRRFMRAFGSSQGLLRTLDGTITFWAKGMERLYGYTAEQAVGRRSDELLKTRFSAPRNQIQATLEQEGHWEGDVIKRRSDSTEVDVATQWSLPPGEKGEPEDVIVLDNDISDRRRAERAVEQSNMLLRIIVETAPGPIFAKDRSGRMLLANAGALQMIGKPWTEVEGRTDVDLLPDRTAAETIMANDRRIMEAGRVEALEEEVADGEGAARIWLSTKTPIRNSDGEVSGLVGVSVEITELKLRANALGKLNAELGDVLIDRDSALQQRDVLLREVYHRVKNNLQIVDGFIVMQARLIEDPGARSGLESLRNRIHALALVHDQLMHSKNLKTFDIAPFLKVLVNTVVDGAAGDGIHLSVSAIPLEVDLDFAIPLGLLVTELVTNSIKHAFPDGNGTITISLERAANGEIALIVSDNGPGRSNEVAMQGAKKSGLGTSIIKGLVKQLHGEQSMSNENGARTVIRVPAPMPS